MKSDHNLRRLPDLNHLHCTAVEADASDANPEVRQVCMCLSVLVCLHLHVYSVCAILTVCVISIITVVLTMASISLNVRL